MKAIKLETHPYSLPLSTGATRSGILIQLTDEVGRSGWGDIAPLPGWSYETLEEVMEAVETLEALLQHQEAILNGLFDSLPPSALFGVESALLDLREPLAPFSVPSAALLMGTFAEIEKQAEARAKEGFSHAKLKIGNLTPKEARALIDTLKHTFRLRIDVNRSWDTKTALRFFESFEPHTFDYVEEPLQDPGDLPHFPLPLALDESLPLIRDFATLPTLKAIICKPTLHGGLTACRRLQELANTHHLSLILSSAFESDIGLAAIASLAFRLKLPDPIGLGTYPFLTKPLRPDLFSFSQGTFCKKS